MNEKHLGELLSNWFEKHARRLPWRQTREPYLIWVSEVMLQQTQVAAVLPYYERFVKRFPTLKHLAKAEENEVLSLWSGLGYYSRAKNLHKGAKYITQKLKGLFPRSRMEILKVPGIGPYTAGAILSIAFDLPEPLVDGNVQRVFARIYAEKRAIENSIVQKFFWEKADQWVKKSRRPNVLNQALMELGATVCTKANPSCSRCPLSAHCRANSAGLQQKLPARKKRPSRVDLKWLALVVQSQGRLLLRKNGPQEWWAGLWDFPRIEVKDSGGIEKELKKLRKRFSHLESYQFVGSQSHTVTHHKIQLHSYLVQVRKPSTIQDAQWVDERDLSQLPVSSLFKKILRQVKNDKIDIWPSSYS